MVALVKGRGRRLQNGVPRFAVSGVLKRLVVCVEMVPKRV